MPIDARRRSISTRSISRDFTKAARCAADVGFAALEVWEEDIRPLGGVPFLRGLLDDLGLRVAQYQLVRNVDGVAEPFFSQALEGARRRLEEAAEIGADSLLVAASIDDAAIDDFPRAVEQLSRLVELASPLGIRVAFEGVSFARVHRSVADAWRLVNRIDHPNLGITIDSAHIALMGEDLGEVGRIPADKIFFVQMADLPRLSGDWLALSRTERLFPGEGIIDHRSFLRAIDRTGYRGYCSLEIFNKANEQMEPMDVARRAAESYDSLVEQTRQIPPDAPLPATLVPLV